MSDVAPTGEEPEAELDAEALADELDLGIELSPEEQIEADKMVAHLRQQFELDPVAETPDEPAAPEEPEPVEPEEPAEPEAPAEPQPVSAEYVVIDGRQVPVSEARSLIDLRNYLSAHPEKAQEVRQVIEGRTPEAPEPPAAPEWLDPDDPAQVAMWQRTVELERQVTQIGQTQAQTLQEQTRARAAADAETGISTFRTLHPELSEDDLGKLRLHAVSLDIIDGLARSRSGPDAIVKALDIAYWDHPEFRAKANAAPSPREAKAETAATRRGKLNALAGTSGSAPRTETPAKPTTDREARAAAAKWLQDQNLL